MRQMAIMPVWLCPFAFVADEWMRQIAIMPVWLCACVQIVQLNVQCVKLREGG